MKGADIKECIGGALNVSKTSYAFFSSSFFTATAARSGKEDGRSRDRSRFVLQRSASQKQWLLK